VARTTLLDRIRIWDKKYVPSRCNTTPLKSGSIILFAFILISSSCSKKHAAEKPGCGRTGTEFVKVIGMGIQTQDGIEIVTDEKGLLIPCTIPIGQNLPDSQPVIVSGLLKSTLKTIPDHFDVTPIDISEIKFLNSAYDKTDITLQVIRSEDYGYPPGFGYYIEDHRFPFGTKILQPHLPAVSGIAPFKSPAQAIQTALLVIYLMRKNPEVGASMSVDILRYTNVVK